ncbi:unnamed protein product [Caenorhabditis bovis]|uniref:N-terminal acetyltransferase B complex subunit MDM20 homolog n=1 Tax=Caenorhabditis bovis TaxID=2654633 RepID=A0A8S1ENX8_9PELO|nr:unnamed protein product [Caenorhabditis bovis]
MSNCIEPIMRRYFEYGYALTGITAARKAENMVKTDTAIIERRLRPVYDALDNNNPKKAIQEVDKILKKHPDTVCAKVLKALSLIRSERLAEAMSIIDAIDVPGVKHDENTLLAFVHCFKEAVLPERINTLYERAVELEPTEANLTQLFMAYARTRQYKKQQAIGLRLYKDFQNPPYYFWAVMAVLMQAYENPELGGKMLLPLAHKMFVAQIEKSGYTEGTGAVELNLLILEGMNRWKDAMDALSHPQAQRLPMPPIFITEKRAEYMVKEQQFDDLKEIAEREIESLPDNWTMWRHRHLVSIETMKKKIEENDMKGLKSIYDESVDFIEKIIENASSKMRGPLMSRLEFIKQISAVPELKDKVDLKKLGDPVDLIFSFIEIFFTKPSCYNDMRMYFCLLGDDDVNKLTVKLNEWIESVSKLEDDHKETKVWAIITYERIRRTFGEYKKEPETQKRQRFQQLIAQIAHPGRSDLAMGFLCQLAISSHWDEWRENNDEAKLYELILLLEYVAAKNKADPVCKLSLIRAYAHLGNTARITALVKLLDIKSVQNDSLGYLTFPIFELAGRFNLAIIVNTQLGVIYDQAEKEIMESVVSAYKNGKFSHIPKLIQLAERMRKSSQAVACDVLNRYLSSLFVIDDVDEAITTCYGDDEPIDFTDIRDNRDLNIIPFTEGDYYPPLIEDMNKRTFKEFVDITKLRHMVCRTIGAIGRVTRAGVDAKKARDEMRSEISAFSSFLRQCTKEYDNCFLPSRLLQSPAPMHITQWVHSGGLQIVERLFFAAEKVLEAVDNGKPVDVDIFGTADQIREELTSKNDHFLIFGASRYY